MTRYKRTVRRLCGAMLLLALCVRALTQTGLDVRAGQAIARTVRAPQFASFLFYLELGRTGAWPEAEPVTAQTIPTEIPQVTAPPVDKPADSPEPQPTTQDQQPVPQPTPQPAETESLQFTAAEASAITVGGMCSYPVDVSALLNQPLALDFDQKGPTVLIVHTHTSEAYTQEAGWEYGGDASFRTQDPDYSIARVGRELAETLENRGISVIHDTSFNDYPSYSGAYARTLEKIEDWVAKYPSIQMVIDVHRDAAADAEGNPVSQTAVIDGTEMAKLMLVIGTDEGGLSHPNWRDNLSWGLKLQGVLNRDYPGLCRNLDLRTERFNQHMTKGSLLVEVGSSGNTMKQAITAARSLGESLADLIEAQKAAVSGETTSQP